MPTKKTGAAVASSSKKAAGPPHVTYRDMIKEGILTLKDRSGSSRQALKKYIQANHASSIGIPATFDSQFNKALRTGVEKGDFTQPKGPSGPVKLAKKDTASKPASTTLSAKSAVKKTATPKKPSTAATATKSTAGKTSSKPKAPAAKKSAPAAKKAAAPAKAKANTSTKRKAKASTSAPAVVEVQQILGKTKSGRVTKTNATSGVPPKAAPKKAAPKKATPAKKATPKQSATPAAA